MRADDLHHKELLELDPEGGASSASPDRDLKEDVRKLARRLRIRASLR